MAQQLLEYKVVVNTSTGLVSVDGLTKGFVNADIAAKKLNTTISSTNASLAQTANKSGLAGAAVVEIGRTISDANYGMIAMANNLSQLSTLMITLISTSGGLRNGLSLLLGALKGPLGLIVLFQIAVSIIERFSLAQRKAKEETTGLNQAITAQTGILQTLGNFATSSSGALEALKRNFKEIGAFLDEAERSYGGLSAEIIDFAVEQGNKLIQARERIKNITEQLTKKDEENILTQKERQKLQLELVKAYELESEALKKLNIGKTEDIILTAETTDEIVNSLKKINEALDPVKTFDYYLEQYKIFLDALKQTKDTKGVSLFQTAEELLKSTPEWVKAQNERRKIAKEEYLKDFELGVDEFLNSALARDAALFQQEYLAGEARRKLREEEKEHALLMYDAIGGGLQALSDIAGKETAAGKAIAVAGALIDTYASIAKQLAAFSGVPVPGYAIAQAIATGLFGLAQVKKILSVQVPGGGGGGGSAGSMAPAPSPTFNVVGSSGSSQLREAVEKGMEKPVKAYVTQKDINSSAELDRNTRKSATIV